MARRLPRFKGPGSRVEVTFDMPTIKNPDEFQVLLGAVLANVFQGRIRRYIWSRDPDLVVPRRRKPRRQ